ncbi:uncharacterized protein LOC108623261 [Ceratina calcarata]|uniref:Uncharacterized protein LOC108623261 n=1 Tax=Ceratina calcarata TaxID=156304 RepID=A0AAJ7N4E9_9HYME|nr:uncharacterized protein LOC108623261 [Ceratina calcarata]XP_026667914.1 uncharacterized protein LOC108623261 [Ceratina calcarata]
MSYRKILVKISSSPKYVGHLAVTWEKLIRKGDVQCKRCQRYGHVASNCNMGYRCVKCKELHKPGECQISLGIDNNSNKIPFCVNCKTEGHPASYRRCSKFKEYKMNLKAQNERAKSEVARVINNPAFVKDGISFANTLKTPKQDTLLNTTKNRASLLKAQTTNSPQHVAFSQSTTYNFHSRIEKLEKNLELLFEKIESLNIHMNHLANMLLSTQHIH